MAQFHVYRLSDRQLVLDLQTDLIDTGTRVVAPLFAVGTGPARITRLEPVFTIGDTDYVLHTAEMAAVPSRLIKGDAIADLTAQDYDIRRALDMVFSGF